MICHECINNMLKLKTQKQVEGELATFLVKYATTGGVSADEIKDWVWSESGDVVEASHNFQTKFLSHFPVNDEDLNEVVQMASNVWNHFPHKVMGGKSPAEIMAERGMGGGMPGMGF